MSRFIWLSILLGILLISGWGYWMTREKESVPLTPQVAPQVPETLEDILARIPASPIKTDVDQALWSTVAVDQERAFIQRVLIEPLMRTHQLGEVLLQAIEQNELNWCQSYLEMGIKIDAGQGKQSDWIKSLAEDERVAMVAKQSLETEKRYESWSLWFVALDERFEDEKKLRKSLERFRKSFDEVTDAHEDDLEKTLQAVHASFDPLYEKLGKLETETSLYQALGTFINVDRNQGTCPVLTDESRVSLRSQISQWQSKVDTQITSIKAGEAESVRLATKAATHFRTVAQQHENTFDAAKSLFLRAMKE